MTPQTKAVLAALGIAVGGGTLLWLATRMIGRGDEPEVDVDDDDTEMIGKTLSGYYLATPVLQVRYFENGTVPSEEQRGEVVGVASHEDDASNLAFDHAAEHGQELK